MAGELIVIFNLLPEIAARLDEVAGKVVRKAAFDVAANAKANTENVMTRRTGFLVNSIYVEPGEDGGDNPYPYSRVQQPEGDQVLLEKVETPSRLSAIVAVGANYGCYLEYGTAHMPPHPYFTPAIEYIKPQFEHAMELALETLASEG